MQRLLEVPMLELEGDRAAGSGFTRLTAQLHHITPRALQEMQILDLVGAVDLIEGKGVAGRQVQLLLTRAYPLDLGGELEAQGGEPRRNLELVDRLPILK